MFKFTTQSVLDLAYDLDIQVNVATAKRLCDQINAVQDTRGLPRVEVLKDWIFEEEQRNRDGAEYSEWA